MTYGHFDPLFVWNYHDKYEPLIFQAGDMIGTLDDNPYPHLHFEVYKAKDTVSPIASYETLSSIFHRATHSDEVVWVDPFNFEIQLGGGKLPYGIFLPGALPNDIKDMIDQGKFEPDYYKDYIDPSYVPCITID